MQYYIWNVMILALSVGVIGLFFMLYLMIKYVGTDILMFLQRRNDYKLGVALSKIQHPSESKVFNQDD